MRPQGARGPAATAAAGARRLGGAGRAWPRRARTLAFGLALCLPLAGCGGPPAGLWRPQSPPAGPLRVLAVMPVSVRGEADSEQSYRRTVDLLSGLGDGDSLDLLGPDEISVSAAGALEPSMATDALLVAARAGYRPEDLGLLRVWVNRATLRGSSVALDAQGQQAAAQGSTELRWTLRGELWQLVPERKLAELRQELVPDPFAERPEGEPHPELRDALQQLGREVAALLAPAGPRPERELGCTLRASPRPVLQWRDGALPSLQDSLAKLDPLDSELRLWQAFQALAPGVDLPLAQRLARQDPGLRVEALGPDCRVPGLQVGDLIVTLDGEPLAHLHALRRRMAQGRALRRKLEVLRGEERIELELLR